MEITKLYSPIRVSLYENGFASENLYDNALPATFVDAINTAIRDNPYTRATENGLMQYFIGDNKAYEIFVKEHVQYAHPTVQHVGDSLNIVLEIGSDITLPTEIVDAIKDHIEFLYMEDWASEIEELDIPIQNAALHESSSLLGLREDMERTYPDYPFRLLNKPSLILNVYDSKWFYIKTEAELQPFGKNITEVAEKTERTESTAKAIKAYIRKNNDDMPDDYAGIVLPTTAKDLQTALEKLNFKPQDIDRCVIDGIVLPRSIPTEVAECFEDRISLIAIDRLNFMASEIQKITTDDDLKQDKLAAALAWANDGYDAYPKIIGVPFESDSLDDVLNVILNLDNFTLKQSIIREEDLGEQVVREEIEAGIRTQDEIDEYFDYDDYAHEIAEKQNGLFYGGYYIACSSFTHYMEMDNAVPEANRVWVDAVTNFLPESQRNKGVEYFRPNIDYTAIVEGTTGVYNLDLAAKIEDFCRTACTSSFSYDGGDIEARGRNIIEIAYMCEKRDKSVIARVGHRCAYRLQAFKLFNSVLKPVVRVFRLAFARCERAYHHVCCVKGVACFVLRYIALLVGNPGYVTDSVITEFLAVPERIDDFACSVKPVIHQRRFVAQSVGYFYDIPVFVICICLALSARRYNKIIYVLANLHCRNIWSRN